jgi:hypothetical protein
MYTGKIPAVPQGKHSNCFESVLFEGGASPPVEMPIVEQQGPVLSHYGPIVQPFRPIVLS